MHILQTRCHPPSQDVMQIRRAVSGEVGAQLSAPKVVVIKAPAGYGKTTTMVQLYRQVSSSVMRPAWLSLDEFNGSWQEAWHYLRHVLADSCPELSEVSPDASSEADAEAALCNALAVAGRSTGVFLDDVHAIHGTAAEHFIGRLIKHTVGTTLWVLGSRAALGFNVSRWRSSGLLLEVDVDALRFSSEEVAHLLKLSSRSGATERLIRSSVARTEGWPAGMKLISIALTRTSDEQAFIERLSGASRGVATFFCEEVFDRLEPDMQNFLLHTSVLGRMCPDLCDSLLQRVDSRAMLQAIDGAGLFIFSLDDVRLWYRYHALFAEFLNQMLRERDRDAALEPLLHRRASDWFAQHGYVPESIQHAFRSGDLRRAAELLDESWSKLSEHGLFVTAERWVAEIPPDILNDFPSLLLSRALYLMCERRLEEAGRLLATVSDRLDAMDIREKPQASKHQSLRHQWLHKQLMLAQFSDKVSKAEEAYRLLVNENAALDPLSRSSTDSALIYTRREHFDFHQLEEVNARTLAASALARTPPALLWHVGVMGPALVMQGKTDAAAAMYHEAIELATSMASDSSDLRALPLLLLADLMTERGEKLQAKALFEKAAHMGSAVGTVDHLIALYVTQARLAFFEGDLAKSEELLRAGFVEAIAKSYDRLRLSVINERIRQALVRGQVEAAQQLAKNSELRLSLEAIRPVGHVTTHTELMATSWARLAIATGHHADAIGLLRQWLSFFGQRGVISSQIRFGILLARAHHVSGDTRAAIRALRDAVKRAATTGLVFVFLEGGDPVRSLLEHVLELDENDASLSDAIHGLQTRFGALTSGTPSMAPKTVGGPKPVRIEEPCDPLSAREVEILSFVSRSLLNKEIAHRLGLTEGSVKWYMQQIYGKLGVRRRMAALDKARGLGYLN